jgi:hypothetical protein
MQGRSLTRGHVHGRKIVDGRPDLSGVLAQGLDSPMLQRNARGERFDRAAKPVLQADYIVADRRKLMAQSFCEFFLCHAAHNSTVSLIEKSAAPAASGIGERAMFASLPAASLRLAVNRRRKVTLHRRPKLTLLAKDAYCSARRGGAGRGCAAGAGAVGEKRLFGTLRGSISAEAARRNDRLEFGEVQFADRAQRLGGRTILKAFGQTIEPDGILRLCVDETGDVVVPSPGPASMVGLGVRRRSSRLHRSICAARSHSEPLRHETPGAQARFLKRQLSLPVSTMSQW